MASCSPDTDPAKYYGFKDLHGFKDFVGFIILCAPDDFPVDDWLEPADQMNLERAFVGLRYGLDLTLTETSRDDVVASCRQLTEAAHAEYQAGRDLQGQRMLEEMDRLLSKLPSR